MYESVIDDVDEAKKLKKEIHNWLKNNIWAIIRNKKAPLPQRIRILLHSYLPKTYNALFAVYQKIKYNV